MFVPPNNSFVPKNNLFVPPDNLFMPPNILFVPPNVSFVPPNTLYLPTRMSLFPAPIALLCAEYARSADALFRSAASFLGARASCPLVSLARAPVCRAGAGSTEDGGSAHGNPVRRANPKPSSQASKAKPSTSLMNSREAFPRVALRGF
jgi:hypothetical protein